MTENGDAMPEPTDAVPDGAQSGKAPRGSALRRALIAGGGTAGVVGVILLILFTGHHGTDTRRGQGQTLTVPPMTFRLQDVATAALDGSNVVSCGLADDAFAKVTDVFGKDTGHPSVAVADAKKAVDEAGVAALAARTPELRSAVAAMKVHLTALHDSAQVNDLGQEVSVLLSLRDDITAIDAACSS